MKWTDINFNIRSEINLVIDDVTIFLGKGAENFDEETIRYCLGVVKSRMPQGSVTELHLQVERGWVQAYCFVKFKKFKFRIDL